MYVIRDIMHCKPGQVKPMVEKFKQLSAALQKTGNKPFRIMTDVVAEKYWTVIAEAETDSVDAYAQMASKSMSDPAMQQIMQDYHSLIESGRREIFKIEA